MNKYLEKVSFDYIYAQAKDSDRSSGKNLEDFIHYKGQNLPPDEYSGVDSPRATVVGKMRAHKEAVLSRSKPATIFHNNKGNLFVELLAEKTEKRDSPVLFGWENRAKFGKYPSKEEFSSALREKLKVVPDSHKIPEAHVNEAIHSYGKFLKKRRLKLGVIGGVTTLGVGAAAYLGNKYLRKSAHLLPPVDDSYIPTEDLSPEQLQELFKIFKLLPGDSPLGQPGRVTKFVRSELRE